MTPEYSSGLTTLVSNGPGLAARSSRSEWDAEALAGLYKVSCILVLGITACTPPLGAR